MDPEVAVSGTDEWSHPGWKVLQLIDQCVEVIVADESHINIECRANKGGILLFLRTLVIDVKLEINAPRPITGVCSNVYPIHFHDLCMAVPTAHSDNDEINYSFL